MNHLSRLRNRVADHCRMASTMRSVKNFALVAVVVACSLAVSVSAQAMAPAPPPESHAASVAPAVVAPVIFAALAFVGAHIW